MTYFTTDREHSGGASFMVSSLLMSGFVASVVYLACARFLVPIFGLSNFDPISLALTSMRGYDLIIAEIAVFLAITVTFPVIYSFIWRPIAFQLLETRDWLLDSIGFGMVLAGFVTLLIKLFVSQLSVNIESLSPLAISIVFASFSLGGMIRLRELNQIEI